MKRSSRSKLDDLRTPYWVHSVIGPFVTDPCAGEDTQIGITNNFRCSGLHQDWPGPWFCNPPFSTKEVWIAAAIEQYRKGNNGILLLPERGSAPWFGPLASASFAHFVMGKKINFIGGPSSNNLGSVLFLFGRDMFTRVMNSGLPGHMNLCAWFTDRSGSVRSS